ncbi:MAG: serine hydrolase [Muribaculaceae bacterium]|nr:serine hydrolase [Muribaculaceae bacterium]
MKNLKIALFLVIGFNTLFANAIDKIKLDSYMNVLEKHNKIMCSLAIDSCGVNIYSRAIGTANVNKKATIENTYEIGSITKTFTATLILKAIEENLISLDTKLSKYFPKIANADSITIEQLLRHRSGVKSYTAVDNYLSWNTAPLTQKNILDSIASYTPDFKPGIKFKYSNSNYTLLANILEIIYKKPYSILLKEKITTPLKLNSTFFSATPLESHNTCHSFKFFDKWRIEDFTNPLITIGAAGIQSTPTDLNKFFRAIAEGDILSRKSFVIMTTIKDNFGMGIIQLPFMKSLGYGFTGGIDGFQSIAIYFPTTKISYSLLSNGVNCILNDVSINALCAANNVNYEIPAFSATSLTTDILDSYCGTYSTPQLPIKMIISRKDNMLIAQGSGQPSFPLEALTNETFEFKVAGIKITFLPQEKSLSLLQGGASFILKKE